MALFIVQMLSGKTVLCGSGINLGFALPRKKYGERRKFLVSNIVAAYTGKEDRVSPEAGPLYLSTSIGRIGAKTGECFESGSVLPYILELLDRLASKVDTSSHSLASRF